MIEREFDYENFWFWPQKIEFHLNKLFRGFLSDWMKNYILNAK
jgi:hypothetical protein